MQQYDERCTANSYCCQRMAHTNYGRLAIDTFIEACTNIYNSQRTEREKKKKGKASHRLSTLAADASKKFLTHAQQILTYKSVISGMNTSHTFFVYHPQGDAHTHFLKANCCYKTLLAHQAVACTSLFHAFLHTARRYYPLW